jgi:translation elongation factor EF-Tu-like GTPase
LIDGRVIHDAACSERRTEMEEKKVGEVIKFFGKIGVAAVRLSEGSLKVGDQIHVVGHTTDFSQTIDSMQVENKNVQEAGPGADIGIKVKEKVREHDVVYKVVG